MSHGTKPGEDAMSKPTEGDELHLAIELEPELRRRIEAAAIERGVSIKEYVVSALRKALESNGAGRPSNESGEWSRLSHPSFARDWDSDADAVYDDLA
jgi:hypothetical protein